jgi:hypothetical protein
LENHPVNRTHLLLVAAVLASACGAAAAPKRTAKPNPAASAPGATLTLEEARQRVAMLDDLYQGALEEVHRWYPVRSGQPIVAATVIKQLQEKMTARGWAKSRFLAVSGVVMHPDHTAKDEFEKRAINELRSGSDRVEAVEGSVLRVATAVPLTGGCVSCHWTPAGTNARAAISWAIPVRTGARP